MSLWTMVRIDQPTHAQLAAVRARLERSVNRFPERYPVWLRKARVSLADTLLWLISKEAVQVKRSTRTRNRPTGPVSEAAILPFTPLPDAPA